ncbi:MAG: lantibiotic dehydratase [Myxococcota bacterium]|nr:lantibiotic dehydratase [Deltaproteobacteria bacterium]MDQ3337072.1 lantibiotic dehydratase [Myxococcota bacterium]
MSTYRPLSRFVLRTPVLPFDVLATWDGSREVLRALVENPAIREALYVASPELDGQIAAWLREPELNVTVERALVRYISRMASRSTPFGLFASVSVGKLGAATDFAVAPRANAERHTRLDNDFLFALCADVVKTSRDSLRYKPNTSLYTAAGRMRYAEARLHGPVRAYHLVAVDRSEYLDQLLACAAKGATYAELVDVLCKDPEITREEAGGFVDEVIGAQLLVADLAPAVTGREPTLHIIDVLDAQQLGHFADPLRQAHAQIHRIDASQPGVHADAYRAIEKLLAASLPTKVEPSRLFQVDLFKPSTAQIGETVIAELQKGAELLRSLTPSGGDPAWERFRQRFTARYETREVPLLEVLDEEVGIGFGDENPNAGNAPLLADLGFPGRLEMRRVSMGSRDLHLMGLVARALKSGANEIELTDADLPELTYRQPVTLANTVTVGAVLIGDPSGDYDIRLSYVGAGANILGRFCHGSEEVAALTAEALRAEEAHNPDAVFAEVVHLPEGRVGNVLLRPVLREYEIPYLGTSGAPEDKQIDVTDLTISVVDDRVVVKSKRLGCEVIPRMTTAHNYSSRALAAYRFLCSHASQHAGVAYWSWGAMVEFPFLPRVRHGKFILERAQWKLSAKDLSPLTAAFEGSNAAKTVEQVRAIRARVAKVIAELRQRLALPRWVVLGDGDNELPIDLDNELMVDSFAHLLKGRGAATLFELLPAHDQLCARGPEGVFAHELLVLLAKEAPQLARGSSANLASVQTPASPTRRFLPGDEWLYVKLYTGTATADTLLRAYLAPVIEQAIASGICSSWFFLRYGDPDWHLRLRFRGDPRRLYGELLPLLHEALAPASERGLLWKLVVDTYEREVERYGGPSGIEIAEELFHADSDAALAIISSCEGDAGSDAAWRLAIYGIDRLMDDLGMSLAEKHAAMTLARDAFGAEIGINTAFQKQLGDKFRRHSKELAALLATNEDPDHVFAPALAAFGRRSLALRPLGRKLAALAAAGRLTHAPQHLLQSYIHMHVNRLIRSSARLHELVLYDLLRRHYDGQIARKRSNPRNSHT